MQDIASKFLNWKHTMIGIQGLLYAFCCAYLRHWGISMFPRLLIVETEYTRLWTPPAIVANVTWGEERNKDERRNGHQTWFHVYSGFARHSCHVNFKTSFRATVASEGLWGLVVTVTGWGSAPNCKCFYLGLFAPICIFCDHCRAFPISTLHRICCVSPYMTFFICNCQRKFRWETSDIRTRSEE